MRAGAAEPDAELARQREQPPARLALAGEGVRKRVALRRADLDLGGVQLAGDALLEDVVRAARFVDLLEALRERQRVGVEDLELLLDPYGEVGRFLERLARTRHVEHGGEF